MLQVTLRLVSIHVVGYEVAESMLEMYQLDMEAVQERIRVKDFMEM